MKIFVNTKKVNLLARIADTFGKIAWTKRMVTELHLHPVDFYHLRLLQPFYTQFERGSVNLNERHGSLGYYWGSLVKFDYTLRQGEVRFSTRANTTTKSRAIKAA